MRGGSGPGDTQDGGDRVVRPRNGETRTVYHSQPARAASSFPAWASSSANTIAGTLRLDDEQGGLRQSPPPVRHSNAKRRRSCALDSAQLTWKHHRSELREHASTQMTRDPCAGAPIRGHIPRDNPGRSATLVCWHLASLRCGSAEQSTSYRERRGGSREEGGGHRAAGSRSKCLWLRSV